MIVFRTNYLVIGILLVLLAQPVFAQRQIAFSGYHWLIKDGYGGPGPNHWSSSHKSIYKDQDNHLHLVMRKYRRHWKSAEVYLKKSLGYGQYTFTVQNRVDQLDKNLTLGLFIYADDAHELDIELGRWKQNNGPNLQYVVQPFTLDGNLKRYHLQLNNSSSTYTINWLPTKIIFSVRQGNTETHHWRYTGENNFVPGSERVHMNFWQYQGSAPHRKKQQQVVITNFSFVGSDGQTY